MKLHTTKVGGIQKRLLDSSISRLKLKDHAAEAGGIGVFAQYLTDELVGSSIQRLMIQLGKAGTLCQTNETASVRTLFVSVQQPATASIVASTARTLRKAAL